LIRGLLLAGGAGARFGGAKLLAVAPGDTEPIGVRAAKSLIAGVGNALAVVRAGDDALASVLRQAGCEVLVSDACAHGMGASLAAAVSASRAADGWLVALGDMPAIAPQTHARVKAALEAGALIAAAVDAAGGRRGHPVGFAGTLGEELARLAGDEGARSVVERHRDRLLAVPVSDPGIHRDIDTRDDLRA
jgi:molybdenum cofactor cytidylyltransferase